MSSSRPNSSVLHISAYFPIRTAEPNRTILDYLSSVASLCQRLYPDYLLLFLSSDVEFLDYIKLVPPNLILKHVSIENVPCLSFVDEALTLANYLARSPSPFIELSNPLYLAIQYGKFYFLELAESNYPKFEYYAWIDAGIMRLCINPDFSRALSCFRVNTNSKLFLQVNAFPYPFYYLRTFFSRLRLGKSAVLGGYFVVRNGSCRYLNQLSLGYLKSVATGSIPIHNEQIFLSSLLSEYHLRPTCYVRLFDQSPISLLNEMSGYSKIINRNSTNCDLEALIVCIFPRGIVIKRFPKVIVPFLSALLYPIYLLMRVWARLFAV